jgi:hypothetical protein
MCPECVRVFALQTTTKCRFAGTLGKPSEGLEPSTPSLPWNFSGNQWQPTATDLPVYAALGGGAFATDCRRLRPLGSIKAPYSDRHESDFICAALGGIA